MYCAGCGARFYHEYYHSCPYCGERLCRSDAYEAQSRADGDGKLLYFLIPAIGAAAVFVLLILGGAVRLPSLYTETALADEHTYIVPAYSGYYEENAYHSESDSPVNTEEDEAEAGSLTGTRTYTGSDMNIRIKSIPEEYGEELEVRTVPIIADRLLEDARQGTEMPAEPVEEPVPSEQPAPTTAPAPPAEHEDPAAPESVPADRGNDAGMLAYDPSAYMSEPFASQQMIPSSCCRDITGMDLSHLTMSELRIARNEIYARHGRKFTSEDLQRYFAACAWYCGMIEPADFDAHESVYLSSIERTNIQYILSVENSR